MTFNPANLGRAQRVDHVVGDRFGHFDQREAVVDLDRADRSGFNPDLAGDGADEIARPDSGPASGADEQPRDVALAPRAGLARAAAGRARTSAAAAAPSFSLDGGGAGAGNLAIVAVAPRRRVRQLHRGRRDVHDVELPRQRLDDDAV